MKWHKIQNQREKLLADADEVAKRNAEGEDDEDGKRDGLYSWCMCVHVYVRARARAYVYLS